MSGYGKRIVYLICNAALCIAVAVGILLLFASVFLFGSERVPEWRDICACIGALLLPVLYVPVAVHELGHILFGLFCGMTPQSVRIGILAVGRYGVRFARRSGGETQLCPRFAGNMRVRAAVSAAGGAILNLICGLLFLPFCLLPYAAWELFLAGFAIASVGEGLRALIPAYLDDGKTDGATILGYIEGEAEEEIALRVFEAQGILSHGRFSEIPRELLFMTPVVREDLRAMLALSLLRTQYLLAEGDEDGAQCAAEKFRALAESYHPDALCEAERYMRYFEGAFTRKKEILFGVNELEKELEERQKRSAECRT